MAEEAERKRNKEAGEAAKDKEAAGQARPTGNTGVPSDKGDAHPFPLWKKCAIGGAALAIVAGLALSQAVGFNPWATTPAVEPAVSLAPEAHSNVDVYASQLNAYTRAGYYQTTDDLGTASTTSVDGAFSIVSFLENTGDESGLIESTRMDVLELEPIEEAVVHSVGHITPDGVFNAFTYNNGWGGLDSSIAVVCSVHGGASPTLEDLCSKCEAANHLELEAGGVSRTVSATFDAKRFVAIADTAERNGAVYHTLDVGIQSPEGQWLGIWTIRYDDREGFQFMYSGAGEEPQYAVTLFGVLDVDENPSSVVFTGINSSPLVKDKFRVETVTAPTKSCHLGCADIFTIEGEEIRSDEFEVTVEVPYYYANIIPDESEFTDALMEDPDAGDLKLKKLVEPYRYSAESVLSEAVTQEALDALVQARQNSGA